MPSSTLFQLMGLPVPPPITTITSNNNQEEGDDDTISILPSQSYDNVIIDLSKASFTEIESKLDSCVAVWGDGSTTNTIGGPSGNASGTGTGTGTGSIAGGIDIARVNSGTSTIEEEDDDDKSNHDGIANDNIHDDHDDHDDGSLNLDESDLSPLLEILLRGKNDDYDEDAMNQSMSIYRKLLRPLPPSSLSWSWSCAHSVSAAATAGSSFKSGITSPSPLPMSMPQPPRLFIHEGTLVYAVRKKYTDVYMMELMNLLLDAMEENNRYYYNTATNSNNNNPSRNTIDGGRILNLALIYGNVGASRVIVKRFPETLSTRDYLRGQLPLHVACHIGMMVEDEDDEDFDEDGFSITTGATGATGRSSVIRRKRRKYRQAELIELLVTEGVRHNVGGANGAGGLYEQDDSGTTPLMQLIHALNNPFTWDDVDEEENHMDNHNSNNNYAQEQQQQQQQQDEKIVNFDMDEETLANTNVAITNKPNAKRRPLANLEICIRAAWNARGPNNHFPILHEAMNISSPDAFYRILEIVKYYDNDLSGLDRRGRTALVKAIYMDKIIQRRTSTKDIIKMILGGVSSKCATLTDGAGRLPLHIAAEMGLLWNEGLGDIVYAHYRALEEPHSVSGFYPFILAAQAGTGSKDLDTIYRLVRERPKLIIRAKRKGRPRVKIPPEFLVNFSEAKRPLTPSVHRPLLHIPAVDRIASDGGSERTKSTINSSEGVAVDPETSIRFQNDEKSSNLFDK